MTSQADFSQCFLDVSSMYGVIGPIQETLKPEEVKRFLCNANLKSKEDLLQRGEGWVTGHFISFYAISLMSISMVNSHRRSSRNVMWSLDEG